MEMKGWRTGVSCHGKPVRDVQFGTKKMSYFSEGRQRPDSNIGKQRT